MPKLFEILMKYKKKISLFLPIKKIDLYVLETFLFKLYKPRSKNYVICIGGMYGEHDLIKLFHKKNYNIKSSIVSACNILPIYLMHSINYDYRFGGFKGDASKELMWENAKKKLGIKKFDLVYIRFPDLFERNNWEEVLNKSLDNITKDGAVFMLIRKADLTKLNRFLKNIKHKPKLIKKTNSTFLNRQSKIFHTVIVFKN